MGFTESVWQCAVADVVARFIAVSAKACALLATKAPDIGVGALSRALGLVSGGSGGKDGGNRKMRGTGGAGSASPSVPLVALTTEGLTHRTPGPPHVSGDGTAGAAPGSRTGGPRRAIRAPQAHRASLPAGAPLPDAQDGVADSGVVCLFQG